VRHRSIAIQNLRTFSTYHTTISSHGVTTIGFNWEKTAKIVSLTKKSLVNCPSPRTTPRPQTSKSAVYNTLLPTISIEIKETGVSLGRRSLQPAMSPAEGHLTTPTVEGYQVCVKISAQMPPKASTI